MGRSKYSLATLTEERYSLCCCKVEYPTKVVLKNGYMDRKIKYKILGFYTSDFYTSDAV